jgi:hypothetical protein
MSTDLTKKKLAQEDIENKVDGILKKAEIPDRHTFFQIEKFMIGKEPTGQSQLWAISRELEARKETIDSYKKDLADAEDNLELIEIKIERLDLEIKNNKNRSDAESGLNIRECEINIRKLAREKDSLIKSARKVNKKLGYILEEMSFLADGYEKIVNKIGEMKPMDDEESQKEMWNEKLLEDFNLRVILQRPLDPDFVRTVMCMHDGASVKKNVVALIDNIQKKMINDRKAQSHLPQIEVKPSITGK